jgi:hypothetical protein
MGSFEERNGQVGGPRDSTGARRSDSVYPEVSEAAAVDAAVWLEGCRQAASRGDPGCVVGAGPITDPALSGAVARLMAGVEAVLGVDAAGRDGAEVLEALVAGHQRGLFRSPVAACTNAGQAITAVGCGAHVRDYSTPNG